MVVLVLPENACSIEYESQMKLFPNNGKSSSLHQTSQIMVLNCSKHHSEHVWVHKIIQQWVYKKFEINEGYQTEDVEGESSGVLQAWVMVGMKSYDLQKASVMLEIKW